MNIFTSRKSIESKYRHNASTKGHKGSRRIFKGGKKKPVKVGLDFTSATNKSPRASQKPTDIKAPGKSEVSTVKHSAKNRSYSIVKSRSPTAGHKK